MASFPYCPERSIAAPRFRQAVLAIIWPEIADPEWRKLEERQTCLLALVSGLSDCLQTSKAMAVQLQANHYSGGNKGRYRVRGYSYRIVVHTVRALRRAGWLLLNEGYYDRTNNGRDSVCARVWPTARLAAFLGALSGERVDLKASDTQPTEIVILKDDHRQRIDYRDCSRSRRTRAVLEQVNGINGKACVILPRRESAQGNTPGDCWIPDSPMSSRQTLGEGKHPATPDPTAYSHASADSLCGRALREEQEGCKLDKKTNYRFNPQLTHRQGSKEGLIQKEDKYVTQLYTLDSSKPPLADFELSPQPPPAILVTLSPNCRISTRLHAVFNGSWDRGGRLYCRTANSFQTLPKRERRALLIDGEPVVELDYRALHVTMLYADQGEKLGECDPYATIAWGDRELRRVAKRLVLVALNAKDRRTTIGRLMEDWRLGEFPGMDHLTPRGFRDCLEELWDDALEVLAPIADSFGSGVGLTLQNRDSAMMLDILEELVIDHGIVCLPVHDSVIVPRKHAGLAKRVMERVFRRHNHGFPCQVCEN
jgi:hypothetical protein